MTRRRIRFPNNELVDLGWIKDIRANNGSNTITIGGGLAPIETMSFESDLSQKDVDATWDKILSEIMGNILSWEEFANKRSK
jgi:hypothetical protein